MNNSSSNNNDDYDEEEVGSVLSDAAVAVPKPPSAQTSAAKIPIVRKLSFGAPSKAALAALAAASEDDNIDDHDIEALMPNPKQQEEEKKRNNNSRQKVRRVRTLERDLNSRHSGSETGSRGKSSSAPGVIEQQEKRKTETTKPRQRYVPKAERKQTVQVDDLMPNVDMTALTSKASNLTSGSGGNNSDDEESDDGIRDDVTVVTCDTNAAVAVPKVRPLGKTSSKTAAAALAALNEAKPSPQAAVMAALDNSSPGRNNREGNGGGDILLSINEEIPFTAAATQEIDVDDLFEAGKDAFRPKRRALEAPPPKPPLPGGHAVPEPPVIKKKDATERIERQKKLRKQQVSFDRVTYTSATSRTTSMNQDDFELNVSRRSNMSRASSHRTLAEIRKEKQQPTKAEIEAENNLRNSKCCGLSKVAWSIVIALGVTGFGMGFVVPLFTGRKSLSTSEPVKAEPPVLVHGDDDGLVDEVTPTTTTVPVVTPITPSTDSSGDLTPEDEAQTTQTPNVTVTEDEKPQETEKPPAEPAEVIPFIDVWSLFGESNELLSPSADQLGSGDALEEDHLIQAAQLFVQGTIQANIRKPKLALERKRDSAWEEGEFVIPFLDTPLMAFDGEVPYPTARAPSDKYPHGDVTGWEDLMARAGVQESDSTVQWDEAQGVLYVAHEGRIDVVDTSTGSLRTTIRLPRSSASAADKLLRDSWLLPLESDEQASWTPAPPKPFIEQLLLTSNHDHLIVVVSNYTSVHQAPVKPLLQDSRVTHLFAFQLTHRNNATLHEQIGEPVELHGRVLYAAQATANQHIHVVTSSRIDTVRLLQDPLERLYYPDRHDDLYVDEVLLAAQEKYIPLFVKRLREEMEDDDLTLLPLTKWITGSPASTKEERELERLVTSQDMLQELVVVTSLSIVQTNDPGATATLRQANVATPLTRTSTAVISTGFLGPPCVRVLGSTDTHLSLDVPGYEWTSNLEGEKTLQEATHILQWELGTLTLHGSSQRAATRFQAMGTVPGRLVQAPRHSIERRGGELRLATIMAKQWKMRSSKGEDESVASVVQESLIRKSFLNVLDETTLQRKAGSPLELFEGQATQLSAVTFLENEVYAFPLEPTSVAAANKTDVQVVKLDGSVVRLAASMSPAPVGFSPHLGELPVAEGSRNRRLLVSIGPNKSDIGLTNGWMLTVWDATEPSELAPAARYSIEAADTVTTWAPQTFRVTPSGQVILPMMVEYVGDDATRQSQNMRGFVVLDVTQTRITERTRVAHSPVVMSARECMPGEGSCGLEGQSFWRVGEDGLPNLLTVEGSTVKLTTLPTGTAVTDSEVWSLQLP